MNKLAIIADDQTGAGDSGIHFARAGKTMALILDFKGMAGQLHAFDSVAISTDSRFLDGRAAAARVQEVAQHCLDAGFTRFFKKIDSTMRGNTGSEIVATLSAIGSRAALVCPAIPKLGRTCREGMILVNGQPLAESQMGHDPFHPLATSAISQLLHEQIDRPCCHLALPLIRGDFSSLVAKINACMDSGCCLIIADAVNQSDLNRLAEVLAAVPELLPVGAAGLAEAISTQPAGSCRTSSSLKFLPGPMLAVVGSMAEVSRKQAEYARDKGIFQVVELDVAASMNDLDGEIARLVTEIQNGPGGHLLLRTVLPADKEAQLPLAGEQVAALLGRVTRDICQKVSCQVVFVTGGSTSVGVANALGIKVVNLEQELLPGVVLGSCEVPGLNVRWFITKAGGFGHDQTLMDLAACVPIPANVAKQEG